MGENFGIQNGMDWALFCLSKGSECALVILANTTNNPTLYKLIYTLLPICF
jgi:hypothetical protein